MGNTTSLWGGDEARDDREQVEGGYIVKQHRSGSIVLILEASMVDVTNGLALKKTY
jgi:hypothetical protein